jgi:hypothetical protein
MATWTGLGVASWLATISLVVATGYISAALMPRLLLFFAACNAIALAVGLSPLGGILARGLPLSVLVGFQAFRLPLEIILHAWAVEGTIPMTMTFNGRNFDIVTGVVAIITAPLAARSRSVAWVANGIGIVLLVNVARVALLSSPLPFAWTVQPPLQLALHLPYAWIVPICVAGALLGHVVLTRALLGKRPSGGERSSMGILAQVDGTTPPEHK